MAEYVTLDLSAASGKSEVEIDFHADSASVPTRRSPYRVPFFLSRGQTYYWTREWQEGEAEADAELRRGEGRIFDDPEEALRWLDSLED